jgi:SAM-dependent methyltransferase
MKLRWYRLLQPLDALCRRVNGKRALPPIHLRRYVGPLESFESSSGEFLAYLKLLAHLRPDAHILDIGCGCGLVALQLIPYLTARGQYAGMDVSRQAIAWCQRHIAARHANFSFIHSDIHNTRYNPNGRHLATSYVFPYEAGVFDVILLKSVFTHMRPEEVAHYLREIARLLADGGCCLATFFLLNEAQQRLAEQGRNALLFRFGDATWRYVDANNPEAAVAFSESLLPAMLDEAGLKPRGEVHYGTWSGRADGLSFQDILLIERA